MFRFVIGIVLIGFLYLGYEFVSTYKAQATPTTEQVEVTERHEANVEQQQLEREERFKKLVTPVWKLNSFEDKAWWISVWSGVLFIWFALFRLWSFCFARAVSMTSGL